MTGPGGIERRADPGPTGKEYRSRTILGAWIAVGIAILLGLNLYGTFVFQPHQAREEDRAIRLSQYVVCLTSGNALRDDVRNEFIDLKEDSIIPVYARVRDTIPPTDASFEILDDAVKRLRERVRTIEDRIPDADCQALYPPLEGQVYPPREKIVSDRAENLKREK
jgi:hypothetical protein